jgi:hypothetical protein
MDSVYLVRRDRQMPMSRCLLVLRRLRIVILVLVMLRVLVVVVIMMVVGVRRCVLVDMNMGMIVARMAMPYGDPALRRCRGIDQQQLGRPRRAKHRSPSNDPLAQYLHGARRLRWMQNRADHLSEAYESQSAKPSTADTCNGERSPGRLTEHEIAHFR